MTTHKPKPDKYDEQQQEPLSPSKSSSNRRYRHFFRPAFKMRSGKKIYATAYGYVAYPISGVINTDAIHGSLMESNYNLNDKESVINYIDAHGLINIIKTTVIHIKKYFGDENTQKTLQLLPPDNDRLICVIANSKMNSQEKRQALLEMRHAWWSDVNDQIKEKFGFYLA